MIAKIKINSAPTTQDPSYIRRQNAEMINLL